MQVERLPQNLYRSSTAGESDLFPLPRPAWRRNALLWEAVAFSVSNVLNLTNGQFAPGGVLVALLQALQGISKANTDLRFDYAIRRPQR